MPILPFAPATSQFRFGYGSVPYTIVSESNWNDPDFPLARMQDLDHVERGARSEDASPGWIICDLGASMDLPVVTIEGQNFATLKLEGSHVANFATVAFSDTFDVSTFHGRTKRRHHLCETPAWIGYRYLRLTPSDLDAGETYYRIPFFAPWRDFEELVWNPTLPYVPEKTQKVEKAETEDDGEAQIGKVGRIRLVFALVSEIEVGDAAALDQWERITTMSPATVCLLDEHRGDLGAAYHGRIAGTIRYPEDAQGDVHTVKIEGVQFHQL